jgi:hypothetical protein
MISSIAQYRTIEPASHHSLHRSSSPSSALNLIRCITQIPSHPRTKNIMKNYATMICSDASGGEEPIRSRAFTGFRVHGRSNLSDVADSCQVQRLSLPARTPARSQNQQSTDSLSKVRPFRSLGTQRSPDNRFHPPMKLAVGDTDLARRSNGTYASTEHRILVQDVKCTVLLTGL